MKYFIVFILLSLLAIIYLSFPFFQKNNTEHTFTPAGPLAYVSIKNKKFYLNGKEFYPIAVNYIASVQTDGKEYWSRPTLDYNADDSQKDLSKDSCLQMLRADMHLIRQMGFNTVRVVGIGEIHLDDSNKFSPVFISAYAGNDKRTTLMLNDEERYSRYFDALEGLFDAAEDAGLKLILLIRMRVDIKTTEFFLEKLAGRFRAEPVILAYDFFNEPLYFDTPERNKKTIFNKVRGWNAILKENAPYHLSTIGLEGIREVFEWDPNILGIDFISYHPYEYEPEQVRNEIYWYGKYTEKPWIIGETAIPSDNDSVSYETQREFALKTLKQSFNCGAAGYSWWQYKDVSWPEYHASYMGVVNRAGETATIAGAVKGTPKPVVEEFKAFDPVAVNDSCIFLSNYYNYSNHRDCRLKGFLVDEDDNPIEGGVVLAWNQWWTSSYHTVTNADGSFELLGDFPFYHWMASATKYSMVRGEALPDTAKKYADGIPTMDLGTLKIERLTFVD